MLVAVPSVSELTAAAETKFVVPELIAGNLSYSCNGCMGKLSEGRRLI